MNGTDMAKDEDWKDFYAELESAEKESLMYLFIDETDMDVEEIYSLVFQEGRKITWH